MANQNGAEQLVTHCTGTSSNPLGREVRLWHASGSSRLQGIVSSGFVRAEGLAFEVYGVPTCNVSGLFG